MSTPIELLPEKNVGDAIVCSVSGGKDSTAMILALREHDVPVHSYVFADTGWEAPQVYEHLDEIERVLGIRIVRVRSPRDMAESVRRYAAFPSRLLRWCTRELKLEPMLDYQQRVEDETDGDVVTAVGVRADESLARASALAFEHDEKRGYVWRPVLRWTVEDVLSIHHRHGVPVNPLYRLGFSRVGCMPCVMANKSDVRLLAKHFPERVAMIAEMERQVQAERERRNAETPGRLAGTRATWFQHRGDQSEDCRIERVVEWARTDRGGKQLRLLPDEQPDSGCFRWGLCDAPPSEDAETAARGMGGER